MDVPATDSFAALDLPPEQLHNLASLGYERMTPIQAQALPLVLAGRDVIGRAKTGSGKTAAFGLGILAGINPRFFGAQALILCPTRELADQVGKEVRRLAQAIPNLKLVALCGGKPFGPQRASLQHGAHIVVGTPGRVLDHITKGTLQLDGLRTLVLDEADRMLDMGFSDAMKEIVGRTPGVRQTLLFSATFPDAIRKMSQSIQREPATVNVEVEHAPDVHEQRFYQVSPKSRRDALLALFEHYQPSSALVFCHTKKECAQVADFLNEHRIESQAIHGDLEQRDRDRVLALFANNSVAVLVATDVAARGLDIKSLQAVINYELPRDAATYVHRIGRTGRAGEQGLALSLVAENERPRLSIIQADAAVPSDVEAIASLHRRDDFRLAAPMATIQIDAGRKNKLRPGDLLGALTGDGGLAGSDIGKIDIFDTYSFVAIERASVAAALAYFKDGRVKGRAARGRRVS